LPRSLSRRLSSPARCFKPESMEQRATRADGSLMERSRGTSHALSDRFALIADTWETYFLIDATIAVFLRSIYSLNPGLVPATLWKGREGGSLVLRVLLEERVVLAGIADPMIAGLLVSRPRRPCREERERERNPVGGRGGVRSSSGPQAFQDTRGVWVTTR